MVHSEAVRAALVAKYDEMNGEKISNVKGDDGVSPLEAFAAALSLLGDNPVLVKPKAVQDWWGKEKTKRAHAAAGTKPPPRKRKDAPKPAGDAAAGNGGGADGDAGAGADGGAAADNCADDDSADGGDDADDDAAVDGQPAKKTKAPNFRWTTSLMQLLVSSAKELGMFTAAPSAVLARMKAQLKAKCPRTLDAPKVMRQLEHVRFHYRTRAVQVDVDTWQRRHPSCAPSGYNGPPDYSAYFQRRYAELFEATPDATGMPRTRAPLPHITVHDVEALRDELVTLVACLEAASVPAVAIWRLDVRQVEATIDAMRAPPQPPVAVAAAVAM